MAAFPFRPISNAKWLFLALLAIYVGCDSGPAVDYSMNSSNVTQRLSFDDAYPFVGFWKSNPSDDFGLAINKRQDGKYTVWFCGPGGSGEIELLSPTHLINDERFRIVDADTIEAVNKDGQFNRWIRSK